MRASLIENLIEWKRPWGIVWRLLLCAWFVALWAMPSGTLAADGRSSPPARAIANTPNHIAAELLVESPAGPGEEVELALHFRPSSGWHGYWLNPGDAGFGMGLDWRLPKGATVEGPRYPVPDTLLISGLMNHVYNGDYAVLVRLHMPDDAKPGARLPITLKAEWLACTDTICVPERGSFATSIAVQEKGRQKPSARFDAWRAALPPLLDSKAHYETARAMLRLAIPLPAAIAVADPHVFLTDDGVIDYAARQHFSRKDDWLIAEIPLRENGDTAAMVQASLSGVIRTGAGQGFAFTASAGPVPKSGDPLPVQGDMPALGWLLLAALAGGVVLNLMPCVFPILSLKALSLARSGEGERHARVEGVAYTAGAMLTCLVLGGVLIALREAGRQVGWAFQLQEPGVVIGLMLLMVAITANLLGLYELPTLNISRQPHAPQGQGSGAFATGVLAAFVATPCTGPFMAAALGAALLLPAGPAMLLFGALGLGLALPFLVLGFVPAFRKFLPQPGAWMVRFRQWMALPMGLTALALIWLSARLGGVGFAGLGVLVAAGVVVALWVAGQRQRRGLSGLTPFLMITMPFAMFALVALPGAYAPMHGESGGVLDARPFSESALAEARASGKPVFAWFTADWCITCKVNEQVAIEREATARAFAEAGVIVLRGDWTRRDAQITRFLTAHGAAGVPLYLWYEPGRPGETLPQVLTPNSLINLAKRPRGTQQSTGQEAR